MGKEYAYVIHRKDTNEKQLWGGGHEGTKIKHILKQWKSWLVYLASIKIHGELPTFVICG